MLTLSGLWYTGPHSDLVYLPAAAKRRAAQAIVSLMAHPALTAAAVLALWASLPYPHSLPDPHRSPRLPWSATPTAVYPGSTPWPRLIWYGAWCHMAHVQRGSIAGFLTRRTAVAPWTAGTPYTFASGGFMLGARPIGGPRQPTPWG